MSAAGGPLVHLKQAHLRPSVLSMGQEPWSNGGLLSTPETICGTQTRKGSFPLAWKKASILPLLKKNTFDSKYVKDYHPISRFPLVAKVLGKHMNVTLSKYVEEHRLLNPAQFGFRPNRSKELALVVATN
ncbi:hypothetical protein NDU88_000806 [Pleurodeles waltl]|uniref:Reverse transcriptase domain-containing protein n=1 Tax=Pleurodeles waltl TaxID=8319 RepID=A0AAV7UTE4_PLEWA|nr:hypothetical protein NDU88_000806 [Pleurodeles waltl]